MGTKSKWFVVATEGATTDGRVINRTWIEQMAKNYDPKNTYGARVNLEHLHFRLYWKDEPHSQCYGDVLAVKAEEREDGKLQLLAEIAPTPELIELNKKGQKVYTSIEVDPNFADTGEAYLVGLAVTDNPASLGTEMLKFAAGASQNPFNARKIKPENLFTAAVETVLEFEEVNEKKVEPSLFDKVKTLLTGKSKKDDERFHDQAQAVELLSNHLAELSEKYATLQTQAVEHEQKVAKLSSDLTALQSRVDVIGSEPEHGYTPRPEITGGELNNERVF
ncbi:GPO family capsid scaffolding protein [Glaesserella parasuis]|nr:GPO family capsid scaffolding protein [Glaesserella parasuis]